jgi:hypothetical protein
MFFLFLAIANMQTYTAYVDETGHSKDKGQRFVGIAGLIAPATAWETST